MVENWDGRFFETVPTLALVPGSVPITAELLYMRFLMHMDTRCSQCNRAVTGSLVGLPGKFTILHISRSHDGRSVVQTKLIPRNEGQAAPLSIGELVSVVCRSGDQSSGVSTAHWISYHQVGGQWFLNNDNRHLVRVNHHPFNIPGQTVDLLCYKNNVWNVWIKLRPSPFLLFIEYLYKVWAVYEGNHEVTEVSLAGW